MIIAVSIIVTAYCMLFVDIEKLTTFKNKFMLETQIEILYTLELLRLIRGVEFTLAVYTAEQGHFIKYTAKKDQIIEKGEINMMCENPFGLAKNHSKILLDKFM